MSKYLAVACVLLLLGTGLAYGACNANGSCTANSDPCGAGQCSQDKDRVQDQLKDGSCLLKGGDQIMDKDRIRDMIQDKLQDGSCNL